MTRRKLIVPNYRLAQNRRGVWEVRWTERGNTRMASTYTTDRDEAERRNIELTLAILQSIARRDHTKGASPGPPVESAFVRRDRLCCGE